MKTDHSAATASGEPFRYRWIAPGDVNGFFALAIDNLALLVGMTGILVGIFKMPYDVVLGKMVPGTAFGVLVGDWLYCWLAFRLAKAERRHDVCAMPLGIDTPSMFGLCFGVVGPAYTMTQDANQAWAIAVAVLMLMGVAKLFAAFAGEAVRRHLPRPALLGALAAVAIALIVFFPVTKIFAEPVGGLIALGVVLLTLLGGQRLPFGIPAVIGSVLLGLAAIAIGKLVGGYVPPPAPVSAVNWELHLPLPTFAFIDGLELAVRYLPLALPMALATVVGGIDNTESAILAGDRYRTRDILLVEAVATMVAAGCGGVIQNTPYIGHPAYKRMGSRAGYTFFTGLFIGVGAMTGVIGWLIAALPESVLVPILVFVGLEISRQAFVESDRKHVAGIVICFLPVIANVVLIQLNGLLGAAGLEVSKLPEEWQRGYLAITMMAGGFIVSAMVWGTLVTWIIDGALGKAALLSLAAALMTLFGVIHSPFADGRMFLPTRDINPAVWALSGGYVLLAAWLAFTAARAGGGSARQV